MADIKHSIVSDLQTLYALQNHIEGEAVYCEEDSQIYTWQEDSDWAPINLNGNGGINMNLYDLNKSIIDQLVPMTPEDIGIKLAEIEKFILEKGNNHYMLLCKEYNYYTIFEHESGLTFPTGGAAVCDIITELGDVYSIEKTEDDSAFEIWIKAENMEQPQVFYLFPYDSGVVYFG